MPRISLVDDFDKDLENPGEILYRKSYKKPKCKPIHHNSPAHTHTMFELGLTFSDQRHSTVAPCEKFLLEMVVPYTFDANFFISDTEEEDQGMVQTTYVAAIAAKDALSSRIHDRHDSAWWFAHGLALNAIKSSQMGSLVDDEGIASHTTSAIPTIPNMSYVEEMEISQPFSFVHDERAYDSEFKRLPDDVKNEDFPVTSLTFRLGEENITFVSVSDFINFIINCELRGKSEYKVSEKLKKCHKGLCEENDPFYVSPERLALVRKRGSAAVVFHFTYWDEKEGSMDVMIYESTIRRATEDPEIKVNGGIDRLYSLRQAMARMPTEQKKESQHYI